MSYRTHDPACQARSPYYQAGKERGELDTVIVSKCPPGIPLGMDPERAGSFMYQQGYADHYMPSPCPGCPRCRGANNGA